MYKKGGQQGERKEEEGKGEREGGGKGRKGNERKRKERGKERGAERKLFSECCLIHGISIWVKTNNDSYITLYEKYILARLRTK